MFPILSQRKSGSHVSAPLQLSYTGCHSSRYKIEGERLVNMVWHHNTNEEELKKVLTDSTGKTHIFSLGVGKIRPEIKSEQRTVAAAILPPPVELFQKIESPSTQSCNRQFDEHGYLH